METIHQSHLISSNHKLTRRVVVVLPKQDFSLTAEKRNESLKINAFTITLAEKVKKILDDHIDKLNCFLDVSVPYIEIKLVSFTNENPDILLERKDKCNSYRLITLFSDETTYSLDETIYNNNDISHLIQINIGDFTTERNSLINACYNVSEDNLAQRIADILLDIAMFHSWFDEENELIDTANIKFRREFSKEKVKFIRDNSEIYNSLILDCKQDDSYYCFSFACYEDGEFDYKKYEKLWKTFIKRYITKEPGGNTIEKQVSSLKITGQLPLKTIKKEYDKLKSGKYLLVISRKKPKNHKIRRQVFCIMGFSKNHWKTNKIKFLPFNDYERIARCIPFIQVSIINK